MLKLRYLFENFELAKEALKNWDHDEETLDGILSEFRISSNAIYPYYCNGEMCFLRLAPTDEKFENNVRGELEFINYLLSRGYNALEPIQAHDGNCCLILNTKWGQYYAASFRRVKGVRLDDTDLSDKIMFAYGKALGMLHKLSSEYQPKNKKWSCMEVLDWIESVLKENKASDVAAGELIKLRSEMAMLSMDSENYGLLHYDFEPDNVFYDESTDSCHVIDFDDGMYGWFALDVEQALDSLSDELEGERFEAASAEFIRGYNTEHPYDAKSESLRPLMRRFVTLYGYARIIRSVSDKFDNEPEWMTGLRSKLGYALAAKEESMKMN